MDIAPTVFGLLNFKYETRFFGRNILKQKPKTGRALMSTYCRMGYLRGNKLVILDVKKKASEYDIAPGSFVPTPVENLEASLLEDAISYYEEAYEVEMKAGLGG